MNKEAKVNLIGWLGFFDIAPNPDTAVINKAKWDICPLLSTEIGPLSASLLFRKKYLETSWTVKNNIIL